MVTLSEALATLYPTANPDTDYVIADTGSGPRIVTWNLPDPQPTAEQIAAVTSEQVAAAARGKVVAAAAARLLAGGNSGDSTDVAVALILSVICDRINAAFAAMSQPKPLLEADIFADLMARLGGS